MDTSKTAAPMRRRGGATVLLALALAAVWLVLAEGDNTSWAVGAVAVALATWAGRSLAAPAPAGARWPAAARFLFHFLNASMISGVHVARRALAPRLSLRPGLVKYVSRLPDESSRVFFANAISLMPGTLTCRMEGARLTVHVLDREAYEPGELRELEDRVAELFAADAGGAQ